MRFLIPLLLLCGPLAIVTAEEQPKPKDVEIIKYDFRKPNSDAQAREFCSWLEAETRTALKRAHGNNKAIKGAIFLFVNRAYESHMPELRIADIFARCVVQAGYTEEEEKPLFDWLGVLAQVAEKVHNSGK